MKLGKNAQSVANFIGLFATNTKLSFSDVQRDRQRKLLGRGKLTHTWKKRYKTCERKFGGEFSSVSFIL